MVWASVFYKTLWGLLPRLRTIVLSCLHLTQQREGGNEFVVTSYLAKNSLGVFLSPSWVSESSRSFENIQCQGPTAVNQLRIPEGDVSSGIFKHWFSYESELRATAEASFSTVWCIKELIHSLVRLLKLYIVASYPLRVGLKVLLWQTPQVILMKAIIKATLSVVLITFSSLRFAQCKCNSGIWS